MSYKEWKQKWNAEYSARPDVKEKKRLHAQSPENKLKERLRKQKYNQRPEVKARNLARQNTPEAKEKKRLYFQRPEVKERQKLSSKKYREKNKDLVKEWGRIYREKKKNDPETTRKRKKYERENKHKILKRRKERLRTDINFKIKTLMRGRVCNALKKKKLKQTLHLLGCDASFLRNHLESQFVDGMSWNNWSKYGWHVDHIVPFGEFDLSNPVHQIAVCNWRNLRPLWAKDNHEKTDKLTPEGVILKVELLRIAEDIYSKEAA
jgi:hypothetical protein